MSSAVDRLVRKAMIERRRPEDNRRTIASDRNRQGREVIEDQKAGYQTPALPCCALSIRASEAN